MFKRTSHYLAFDRVVLVELHVENRAPGIADPDVQAKIIYSNEEGETFGGLTYVHGTEIKAENFSDKTLGLMRELIASIEEDVGRRVFEEGEHDSPNNSSGPETDEGLTAGLGGSR